MITYSFDNFRLEYAQEEVTTIFYDGTSCPVCTSEAHRFHSELLGIKAPEYNLLHELAHHQVAIFYGLYYCPIVWASAHGQEMPIGADLLEWKITAVSYMAFNVPMRHEHEWGAIRELSKHGDVYHLKDSLYHLWAITKVPAVKQVALNMNTHA